MADAHAKTRTATPKVNIHAQLMESRRPQQMKPPFRIGGINTLMQTSVSLQEVHQESKFLTLTLKKGQKV
ncbi:hypothetical protein BOW51_11780 [Solemya velesiana gill symbiont]|uniref:Uncharacterized protein n=1 Tax=Solemya velesiana gill symbiont TaxID=1918948 RepID=A0A1T2KQ27_9GAMM|nr:hypothetical protein BOW51_11780 [Solemya velesiana gill symbiont]